MPDDTNKQAMPPVFSEDVLPPMPKSPATDTGQQVVNKPSGNDTPQADLQNPSPATVQTSTPSSAGPTDDIQPPAPLTNIGGGTPKKKFAGGKVIATILGLLLMIGSVGAGVYLVKQNQDIREKAGECDCGPVSGNGECQSGYHCTNNTCGTCVKDPEPPPPPPTEPPSCFLPGTRIDTGYQEKFIESIKVGDRVLSFVDNKIVQSKVSNIYKLTRNYYFKLEAGNWSVNVTAEHPFYIGNNNYKTVQNLKVGDQIFVLENNSLTQRSITSMIRVDKKVDVYNLTVDNTSTFFANGFAVHNKGEPEPPPACTNGQTRCGGVCIDLDDSESNCGSCGTTCTGGNICEGGKCVTPQIPPNDPGAPYKCVNYTKANCPNLENEPGPAAECVGTDWCIYTRLECKISNTYCFLELQKDCKYNERCDNKPPPTTPPGTQGELLSASCTSLRAYSSNWTLLNASGLSSLKAGDKINLCVMGTTNGGSFDKAKLTINGVVQAETTQRNPNRAGEFCQNYTIPAGTTTFNIKGQIHHTQAGWK